MIVCKLVNAHCTCLLFSNRFANSESIAQGSWRLSKLWNAVREGRLISSAATVQVAIGRFLSGRRNCDDMEMKCETDDVEEMPELGYLYDGRVRAFRRAFHRTVTIRSWRTGSKEPWRDHSGRAPLFRCVSIKSTGQANRRGNEGRGFCGERR